MASTIPVGVRVLDRLMKASPSASIARMDAAALERAQAAGIPDKGVAAFAAGLFLGRLQKGVEVRATSFPARHGEVPLRVYTPESWSRSPRPVVLNFHGGGFALGSARQGDWLCSLVARELDAIVVSVDYRLAPKHPFPAGVEDCYDGLLWTAGHVAGLGADPARIGVMGDSAGGNLAAVVSIMAREHGGPKIGHQALIYPATDMTDALEQDASYRNNHRGIVLSNEDMEIFHGHYVTDEVDPTDYRLSPICAEDLSGLPPALVVVAGHDPLHDCGVRYAERLVAAGTPARVVDFHQMPHGFVSFPLFCRTAARQAVEAVVASQREALA